MSPSRRVHRCAVALIDHLVAGVTSRVPDPPRPRRLVKDYTCSAPGGRWRLWEQKIRLFCSEEEEKGKFFLVTDVSGRTWTNLSIWTFG